MYKVNMEKPHVLIVDDEPMVLSSVADLLEFEYVVHQTHNPYTALEILSDFSLPIKVIMSDQRMPGMYGHELLREAKKLRPNVIRLLLTGYSDLESIMYSVNVGEIFRYINKPWRSDTLLNVFKLAVKLHDQMTQLEDERKHTYHKDLSAIPTTHTRTSQIEIEEDKEIVLFVGYDEELVQQCRTCLGGKYAVISLSSVDDVFKEVAQHSVSVIVSEINLQGYDAVDFLSTIKKDYPHIVTVILTNDVDASLAIRAINELNVFRYLTKPIKEATFRHVIEDAASRSREYSSKSKMNLYHAAAFEREATIDGRHRSSVEADLREKLKAAQAALTKRIRNS
ncbi:response regulator receiver protein [Chloroherpeton thalassium ATCC 35110]|uniref:Response regulator receiver protein n=1 Tax=Chloroherpeton thalassium (strain ATCC 35110 / GB-78) TaxID=517418 RepID=B3QSR3_CHLT3|nr:response regulator [Chloroherpeton thalassium]ACF14110.1 response regulator receiver protein [Chloroherpeton thalassium ATCC 35110]